jgi:hypothetical protein
MLIFVDELHISRHLNLVDSGQHTSCPRPRRARAAQSPPDTAALNRPTATAPTTTTTPTSPPRQETAEGERTAFLSEMRALDADLARESAAPDP